MEFRNFANISNERKENNIMSNSRNTARLGAELLNEIGSFLADADDNMLRKTIVFIRSQKRKEEKKSHAAPCQYTVEEMKQQAVKRMEECRQGKSLSTEEVMESIKEWL